MGTPGSPAGLEYVREKYGTLPRAVLMAPAIRLAREGFTIGQGDAGIYQIATADLAIAADTAGAMIERLTGAPARGAEVERALAGQA